MNPEGWKRLAHKELRWTRASDPPARRAIDAYLYRQIAQSEWIAGRSRAAVVPALRAWRRDSSVIDAGTLRKYVVAALMPSPIVRKMRARARAARAPGEPDPWLDLSTPLPE
jgi:hypothetical protein